MLISLRQALLFKEPCPQEFHPQVVARPSQIRLQRKPAQAGLELTVVMFVDMPGSLCWVRALTNRAKAVPYKTQEWSERRRHLTANTDTSLKT